MCDSNCCCCVPGKVMVIIGVVFSLIEVICAAVVNFHTFGFVLGLICFLGSAGFLLYLYKMSREDSNMSINEDEHS